MSSDEVSTRVMTWIQKTGLPLELEATAAFNKVGFDSDHSYVYEDPELQKGREIDVVGRTTDPIGLVQIFVAAECKASSKPWVVLTNRAFHYGSTYAALGVSTPYALEALSAERFVRGKLARHLKGMDTGGYALKQAFSDDVDGAYGATMSALKAAAVLVTHEEGRTRRLAFAFPVVVVDAPIFECFSNERGDLELEEVLISQFMFTALIPQRTRAIVRIVHREALSRLASNLYDLATLLKEELQDKVDEFMETIRMGTRVSDANTYSDAEDGPD